LYLICKQSPASTVFLHIRQSVSINKKKKIERNGLQTEQPNGIHKQDRIILNILYSPVAGPWQSIFKWKMIILLLRIFMDKKCVPKKVFL